MSLNEFKIPLNLCQLISLLESTRELSEAEIVVSIMGCLSGSETVCFGWSPTDNHFFVRNGLSADKLLNQTLLHNYLNYYCKYGTAFKLMFNFCYEEVKDEDIVICFTFNAFRSGLRHLLIDYIKHLNTITDQLVTNNKDNKSISLLGLKYWLDSDQNHNLLLRIEILWQMFERIREIAINENTNYSLSFAILNAIYERIDFQKTFIRSIVYQLFIDCLKPTLDYFDYILTNGLVRDSHQEFVFTESDQNLDPMDFWSNCLKIRNDLKEVPLFLAKHLDSILIAAKSQLMSRRLTFVSNSGHKESIDLFNKFLNIIKDLIQKSDCFDENTANESKTTESDESLTSDEIILPKCLALDSNERTVYDSNLNYFDVYSDENHFFYNYNINFELNDKNHFIDYYLPKKSIKPIELILNEALTQTFGQTCRSICSQLIAYIIDEYNKYFNNFCDIYLLRSCRVMPAYCLQVFQNLVSTDLTKTDCLYAFENESTFESIPDIKPFISYDNLSSEPIEFLKNIHLIYSSIHWPLNTLFGDPVIGVFNKVFQLLLQIKYSKWLLNQLFISSEFRSRLSDRRLQNIMCFKLQNTVNKLYNHLMTQIDGHINETVNRLKGLTNFEDLLEIHNEFVVKLKQTIFSKQKTLRNVVKKVLNLCSDLNHIWSSVNEEINDSTLESIDLDINRCNHLLESYYEVINN